MSTAYHNETYERTAFVHGSHDETSASEGSWALPPEARARLQDEVRLAGGPSKVARATGLQGGTLNKILNGAGDVGASRLAAICAACGVTMDYILTGVAPEPVQPALASADLAIASAETFAVAIDCLPVGKDIRNRLQAHIQAHIYLLRRCAGETV